MTGSYPMPMAREMTVTLFLHRHYRQMHEELRARALDRDMSPGAPAFVAKRRYESEGLPHTAQAQLNMAARFYVGDVGVRVMHHVNALAVAYCPEDPDPQGSAVILGPELLWPKSATFTLARSILEGAGVSCWLMAPDVDPDERLRRMALVQLWYAYQNDQDPTEPRWLPRARRLVEEAGFTIHDPNGRGIGLRCKDKPPARFGFSAAIRSVFGEAGMTNYRRWSGRTHNALWASKNTMQLEHVSQGEASGYFFQSKMEEPTHLAVAANIAETLSRVVDVKAALYGQQRDGVRLRQQAQILHSSARKAEAEIG